MASSSAGQPSIAAALPEGLTTAARDDPDTRSMRTSEPKVSVEDNADAGATNESSQWDASVDVWLEKKNLPFPDVAGDGLGTVCAVKPEPVTAGLGVLGSEFA